MQHQVNISKITLTFTLDSAHTAKTFDGLCKVGIFSEYQYGIAVPNYPNWSVPTIDFDLLIDRTRSILLPDMTISPATAFTITWKVKKVSD